MTSQQGENGKIDVELGKFVPVVCLCPDPDAATFGGGSRKFAGWDALIIGTSRAPFQRAAYVCQNFWRIDALDEVNIQRVPDAPSKPKRNRQVHPPN